MSLHGAVLNQERPQWKHTHKLAVLGMTQLRRMSLQVPDVEKFMADYNMQCPMAAKRLIYSGMPATVEHGKPRYGISSRGWPDTIQQTPYSW